MGTLILPPIHFRDQVSNPLKNVVATGAREDHRPLRIGSSSSSGSSRSPLGLPMAVSSGHTRASMADKRTARRRRQHVVGHATRASGIQCEENRKRFESALYHVDGFRGDNSMMNNSLPSGDSNLLLEPGSTPPTSNVVSLGSSSMRSPNPNSTVFSFSTTSQQSMNNNSLPSITDNSTNTTSSPAAPSGGGADRHLPEYFRATSCSIRSRTNGPTVVGSPLYNRPPTTKLFLSEEPATTGTSGQGAPLNHERYRTRSPAVQQNLDRVSSAFKVISSPRQTKETDSSFESSKQNGGGGALFHRPPVYSDVLFVPVSEAEAEDFSAEAYFREHTGPILSSTFIDDVQEQNATLTELPKLKEVINTVDGQCEKAVVYNESNQLNNTPSQYPHQNINIEPSPGCAPPEVPAEDNSKDCESKDAPKEVIKDKEKEKDKHGREKVNLVPKGSEKDVSKGSTKPKAGLKSASKTRFAKDKQDGQHQKPTSAGKAGAGDRRPVSAGSSGSSASSSLPSRPSSATYWRQKTWVDDATVTSEQQGDAEGEGDDAADPRTKTPDGKPETSNKGRAGAKSPEKGKPGAQSPPLKSALKKPTCPTETQKAAEENKPPETVDQNNAEEKKDPVEVVNLKDLKRIKVKLPDFICPSSEDKSKESAVLDWLETTSNHWAMKTSPLL